MRAVLLTALHGERDLPLGLLYVAQALLEAGVRVRLVDLNLRLKDGKLDMADAVSAVRGAEIVGFSSYRLTLQADAVVGWMLRKAAPSATFVWGGWGPTLHPSLYFELAPVDVIVRGVHMQALEEIVALVRALEEGRPLREVPGVAFLEGGRLVQTKLADVPEKVPPMRWEIIDEIGLDPSAYLDDGVLLVPVLGAIAACPKYYHEPCIYCSIARVVWEYRSVYGDRYELMVRRLRSFDVERVVGDIRRALEYFRRRLGRRLRRISFTLVDDSVDARNFGALYRRLKEEGLFDEIAYLKFQTRPEQIPRILLCVERRDLPKLIIDVGLEFRSERDLAFARRGYGRQLVDDVIALLAKAPVRWTGYVILSTPVSGARDLKDNIELALDVARSADLLRCNPYLLEEATLMEKLLGDPAMVKRKIVVEHDGIRREAEVPYRPRFLAPPEELRRMIRVVVSYEHIVERFKELAVQRAAAELARIGEQADLLELGEESRVFTIIESLDSLLDALRRLKQALFEDLRGRTIAFYREDAEASRGRRDARGQAAAGARDPDAR